MGAKKAVVPAATFIVFLIVLSFVFFRENKGIQGDGIYYYSVAVSILWDGDLDLRNQYDHPVPNSPQRTVTGGIYAVDTMTGKAFTLFNPGTGLFMIPAMAAGRLIDRLRGGPPRDAFDLFYQKCAGYSAVLAAALAALFMFLILRRRYSLETAAVLPALFLFGTNWLFYATVFAAWSHAYAVFLSAFLIWAFLRLIEKNDSLSAFLFGFSGGLFFATRNFSVLFFTLLFLLYAYQTARKSGKRAVGKSLLPVALILLTFLAGAAPQLLDNDIQHGSPFLSGYQAVRTAEKHFGFLENADFRVMSASNLYQLYSNLFNSNNGLFFVHPLYFLGLLGLVFVTRGRSLFQKFSDLLFVGLILFWFIDASYYDNWFIRAAGSGFGHRRFLDFLPVFIIGAANLLEKSREKKIIHIPLCGFFALFTAGAGSYFVRFLAFDKDLSAAHDSFFAFWGYLWSNGHTVAAALITLAILVFPALRKASTTGWSWRGAVPTAIILAVFLSPLVAFRPDSAWLRQRFIDKKGFFLMYSQTPYVRLASRFWGDPENGGRPLRSVSGEIELPAPLKKGDLLLFKLMLPAAASGPGSRFEIYCGEKLLGTNQLNPTQVVYSFPVEIETGADRLLLSFPDAETTSSAAFFQEGRLIFKERDEPPFGRIDDPPQGAVLDSDRLIFGGWALDDRGVEKIILKRKPDSGEKEVVVDDDGLITLGEAEFKKGTRPDIESVYVLYPFIDRAGWRFTLERRMLPDKTDLAYKISAVAVDTRGNKTTIGERKIVVKKSATP